MATTTTPGTEPAPAETDTDLRRRHIFCQTINVGTSLTSNEHLLTYDNPPASLPNAKRLVEVAGEIELSDVGATRAIGLADVGTAGVYAFPSSLETDDKGRVIDVTAGTQPITVLDNVGTGAEIVKGTIVDTAAVRSLIGTTGHIDATQNTDDITFSLPNVGTPNTYAFPASLTTDTQGRVSAVTAGSQPVTASSGAGLSITTGTISLADGVAALEALSSLGYVAHTGADTYAERSLLTDSAGGLLISNSAGTLGDSTIRKLRSGFNRRKTGNLGISDATETTISAYSTDSSFGQFDDGNFDRTTGIWTCPLTGVYRFEAQVCWASNATGLRHLYLRVNSDTSGYGHSQTAESAGTTTLHIAGQIVLTATDTVRLRVTQTSTGSLNVLEVTAGSNPGTWWSMSYEGQ
jgi:hypothetical protein